MTQFIQWWAMGGYATYVWPAYGIVCFVLIVNLLGIRWQYKRTRKKLQQWFNR